MSCRPLFHPAAAAGGAARRRERFTALLEARDREEALAWRALAAGDLVAFARHATLAHEAALALEPGGEPWEGAFATLIAYGRYMAGELGR